MAEPESITSVQQEVSNKTTTTDTYYNYDYYEEQEIYTKTAYQIWKFVAPIILFLGTAGNVMTIFVLTHSFILRRTSTSVFLRALAISDLLVIYVGLLPDWINRVFDVDILSFSNGGCKVFMWLIYFAISNSAWLLVAVTFERIVSVRRPMTVKLICSKNRAAAIVVMVTVTLLCVCAVLLVTSGVRWIEDWGKLHCWLAVSRNYDYFSDRIWPWIDLTISAFLPFLMLTIGNAVIIYNLERSKSLRKSLTHSMIRDRNAVSISKTIITANFVFLLTQIPACVYFIFEQSLEGYGMKELLFTCTILPLITNSSTNFLIYSVCGAQFRRETIKIFSRLCPAFIKGQRFRHTQQTRHNICDESIVTRSSISTICTSTTTELG